MMLYGLITIGVFLLASESLFYWRIKLIDSHRALARSIIIGETSLDFWMDIRKFNSFGGYTLMFWDWRRWRFESFYPGILEGDTAQYLGDRL